MIFFCMIKDYKIFFNVNGNISYIKSINYLMSFYLFDFLNLNFFEWEKNVLLVDMYLLIF